MAEHLYWRAPGVAAAFLCLAMAQIAQAAPVNYNRVLFESSISVTPSTHLETELLETGQVVLDVVAQQVESGASATQAATRTLTLGDAAATGTSLASESTSAADDCEGAPPCPEILAIDNGFVTLPDTSQLFRPKGLLAPDAEFFVNVSGREGRAQGEDSELSIEALVSMPASLQLADLSGQYQLVMTTHHQQRFIDGTLEERGSVRELSVVFSADGTCSGSDLGSANISQETFWPAADSRESVFARRDSGSDFVSCGYTVDAATGAAVVSIELSDGGDTFTVDLPLFVSAQGRYVIGALTRETDNGTTVETELSPVVGVRTGASSLTNGDLAGVYFMSGMGESFGGTVGAGLDSDFVSRSGLEFSGSAVDGEGFSACALLGSAFAGSVRTLGGTAPGFAAASAAFTGNPTTTADGCRYRVANSRSVTVELMVAGVAQMLELSISDDAQTLLGTRLITSDDPLPLDVDVSLPVPATATTELVVVQRYQGSASDSVVADFVAPIVPALDPAVNLVAAVLPGSRSVQVGSSATAFATMINAGSTLARGCDIRYSGPRSLSIEFQETEAATNARVGEPNRGVDIPPNNGVQTWFFSITPNELFAAADITLDFSCLNGAGARTIAGVNTLLLSSSPAPVADVIALALTPSANGIVELSGADQAGFLTLATFNVGASDTISVSVDTGAATLPLSTTICQTDPATAVCINPAVPGAAPVTLMVGTGDSPTFAVFVNASQPVGLDPANSRIFVRFEDSGGQVRGATSVAVTTD